MKKRDEKWAEEVGRTVRAKDAELEKAMKEVRAECLSFSLLRPPLPLPPSLIPLAVHSSNSDSRTNSRNHALEIPASETRLFLLVTPTKTLYEPKLETDRRDHDVEN